MTAKRGPLYIKIRDLFIRITVSSFLISHLCKIVTFTRVNGICFQDTQLI